MLIHHCLTYPCHSHLRLRYKPLVAVEEVKEVVAAKVAVEVMAEANAKVVEVEENCLQSAVKRSHCTLEDVYMKSSFLDIPPSDVW